MLCLCPLLVAAQRLLRGKIVEKETSTPICGACIAVKGTKQKTLSDRTGGYELTVPTAGAYTIEVSAVGYKRLRRSLRWVVMRQETTILNPHRPRCVRLSCGVRHRVQR